MDALVETYRRDGFCVVGDILSKDRILEFHDEISQVLMSQLDFLGIETADSANSPFALMKKLFQSDRSRYLAALRLISRLYSLQMLLLDENVLRLVRRLGLSLPVMQARPVFHVMSEDLRFEQGYFGFGVHQDWPALQGSLDMVTVWVPLVDVDKDLFPLEVIPGSHMHGLLPGQITQHILEVDPGCYADADFVPVEAKLGDVVIMSAFALHRSGTEGRLNDVRLAASCRYENAMESCFVGHGFPFCQQTVVKRELLFENFPSKQQIAAACALNQDH